MERLIVVPVPSGAVSGPGSLIVTIAGVPVRGLFLQCDNGVRPSSRIALER